MRHTSVATIPLEHVSTITWAPAQPWHRVVAEIREVLNTIDEDAEVEMQPNGRGEPVLYLSFPRGPLVEFPEGGVLTVCRDTTGTLVAWASSIRRQTPLGNAKLDEIIAAGNRQAEEVRARSRRLFVINGFIAVIALMAYPFAVGLLELIGRTSS